MRIQVLGVHSDGHLIEKYLLHDNFHYMVQGAAGEAVDTNLVVGVHDI